MRPAKRDIYSKTSMERNEIVENVNFPLQKQNAELENEKELWKRE